MEVEWGVQVQRALLWFREIYYMIPLTIQNVLVFWLGLMILFGVLKITKGNDDG